MVVRQHIVQQHLAALELVVWATFHVDVNDEIAHRISVSAAAVTVEDLREYSPAVR